MIKAESRKKAKSRARVSSSRGNRHLELGGILMDMAGVGQEGLLRIKDGSEG
jgi:hypothetical protein